MLARKLGIAKRGFLLYARFISRWKYRFSSDQRSQATLSGVSTEVGDHSGTLRDLAFFSLLLPSSFSWSLGGGNFYKRCFVFEQACGLYPHLFLEILGGGAAFAAGVVPV